MTPTEAKQILEAHAKESPGIVINDNWYDMLEIQGKRKILTALRVLTRNKKNMTVFTVYEKYTLEELIGLDHQYWKCQCAEGYIHDRDKGTNRCTRCGYKPFYLPSPSFNEVKYCLNAHV